MTRQDVSVNLDDRQYDILIGDGLLPDTGRLLGDRFPGVRFAIVTDDTVASLHLDHLQASLSNAGLQSTTVSVPPGETSKSLTKLGEVVDALLAARLERTDMVIAFGGGVVGDLAGFAAAIVRRGVDYVQIPTTLLAQVDSSVGGKTGINASAGKNLIGAFLQPRLVIADTAILDTLSRREFAAGYAETVKYGLIEDAGFFDWLVRNHGAIFGGGMERAEAVAHCCRSKAKFVVGDETEFGDRALLNLGHTFGHALETWCEYDPERLIHGEAVAIGMVLAHQFSEARGLAPAADTERVVAHLSDVGLPTEITHIKGGPPPVDLLMHHIAQDKKVRRGQLNFILTHGIGRAFIAPDIPPGDVQTFLMEKVSN